MLRNALALARIVRANAAATSSMRMAARRPGAPICRARVTGMPFLTTWYKGFREQNCFKRLYNSVMARGDRVIAVSDQIADLIIERYGTPWERIAVMPASIDFERFDPARYRASASTRCATPGASAATPRSSSWSAACCAARAITWWSRRCAGSRRWG